MIQKIKESLGLYRPTLKELQERHKKNYKYEPKPENKLYSNPRLFLMHVENVSSYKY